MLILHGWGDSSAGWRAYAQALAADYDVIVPDLPGFGGTESPKDAWGVTQYAQFIRAFLQKIGVKPYAIIGHSNGGAIAVRGVGQGLLQAEKLVLLASAGVRSPKANLSYRVIAKVGKAVTKPLPKRVSAKLRRTLYQKVGSDLLVAEHLQETFKKIVRDDVRADAAYISIPTLLVYGSADTDTPVSIAQELQKSIDGSRLEVLPGAGHFVHIDAAHETERLIREHIGA